MKERLHCSPASGFKMYATVRVCVCVCFPNWTGIVAEVKRGQLSRSGAGTETEQAGGLGL